MLAPLGWRNMSLQVEKKRSSNYNCSGQSNSKTVAVASLFSFVKVAGGCADVPSLVLSSASMFNLLFSVSSLHFLDIFFNFDSCVSWSRILSLNACNNSVFDGYQRTTGEWQRSIVQFAQFAAFFIVITFLFFTIFHWIDEHDDIKGRRKQKIHCGSFLSLYIVWSCSIN